MWLVCLIVLPKQISSSRGQQNVEIGFMKKIELSLVLYYASNPFVFFMEKHGNNLLKSLFHKTKALCASILEDNTTGPILA